MLPPGLSYKRPFQLRPLFCLYASLSVTGLQGIKIQGIKTANTTGLGHTGADLMQTARQLHFIYSGRICSQTEQILDNVSDVKEIFSVAVRNDSVFLWGNRLTRCTAAVVLTALPTTPPNHSSPPHIIRADTPKGW